MSRRSLLDRALDLVGDGIEAAEQLGPMLDRAVGIVDPERARARAQNRRVLAAINPYEGAQPSRKRRFHRGKQSGETLTQMSAVALRDQARHLERNSDIVSGILDKLVDFTIGPNGITVESQPKRTDGSIHEDFAQELEDAYAEWSEWPEVTWTHDRAAAERLGARTWFRDGEVLAQEVIGERRTIEHGSSIPYSLELLEPDLLPYDFNDLSRNIRQGIERNAWGRPIRYHLYKQHPGDAYVGMTLDKKAVPAERILHVRHVNRIGQLRGISVLAPVIPSIQDLAEYLGSERAANKMASSLVLKMTRGLPEMYGQSGQPKPYDPLTPPVYQMDGGMIVVQNDPGENTEFFDTKRPNSGAPGFISGEHRRIAAGVGLSYSAVSRDYNGTYSAQRQELVENWPHYHALTGVWVSQWSRPSYQRFAVRYALGRRNLPRDLDLATVANAAYYGPAMPWIDPEKEANANLILVQACFKSSAQVIRERGGSMRSTYKQIEAEKQLRADRRITSSVDVAADLVSPAKPTPTEPQREDAPAARTNLRVIK